MVLSILFLVSCATAVPEIYLKQSDMKMVLNKEAYGKDTLAISHDGKYILAASMGDIIGLSAKKPLVHLWDITEGKHLLMKPALTDRIHSVALSPDGRYSAAGGWVHIVQGLQGKTQAILEIWDLAKDSSAKTFKDLQGSVVSSVNFSPDGTKIVSGSED